MSEMGKSVLQALRQKMDRPLLGGLLVMSLLTGCMSKTNSNVQVIDRNDESAPRQPVQGGHYVVRPGDTLYGIAFRFGWDWKQLAMRNNIAAPYTIRPGQTLLFSPTNTAPVVAQRAPVTPISSATTTTTRPVTSTSTPVVSRPVVTTVTNVPPASTPVSVTERSASGWSWPTAGTLIGRFSASGSLNKGIDLAGTAGQSVLAASDGSVVYAGSGLRGYGELVIIKHNDTYVSAYGHNQRLLVREGQRVQRGQKIAEMGSSGTDRVKLHFEIRRQGKPVDPLQYLPRR